jgi:hypothetical protein
MFDDFYILDTPKEATEIDQWLRGEFKEKELVPDDPQGRMVGLVVVPRCLGFIVVKMDYPNLGDLEPRCAYAQYLSTKLSCRLWHCVREALTEVSMIEYYESGTRKETKIEHTSAMISQYAKSKWNIPIKELYIEYKNRRNAERYRLQIVSRGAFLGYSADKFKSLFPNLDPKTCGPLHYQFYLKEATELFSTQSSRPTFSPEVDKKNKEIMEEIKKTEPKKKHKTKVKKSLKKSKGRKKKGRR